MVWWNRKKGVIELCIIVYVLLVSSSNNLQGWPSGEGLGSESAGLNPARCKQALLWL